MMRIEHDEQKERLGKRLYCTTPYLCPNKLIFT